MKRVAVLAACLAMCLAVAIVAARQAPSPVSPQPPPAFRSGVTLVPVNVRAVDANGNPVTDLTAADFTVFENGKRQQIAHFSTQSSRGASSDAAGPSTREPRTVFIVLGRGRLNEPAKGLDAVIEFVRSGLQPGDRVGVLALLHLAELTTDRDAIVRLLGRYRTRHENIAGKLDRDGTRGGPRGAGAPDWPLASDTLSDIDEVFNAPGLPPVRHFPGGAGGKQIVYDDWFSLGRTLEYLRHLDGEKHLVMLVANTLPHAEVFARRAAAARVTVSMISVGGVRPPRTITAGRQAGAFDTSPIMVDTVASFDSRTLAEETGGVAAFYQDATRSLAQLERVTSFQYLLGYYPATPPPDGQYRELRVDVKRRGITLLYRRGFEAQPPPVDPIDLRTLFAEAAIRYALPISQRLAIMQIRISPRVTRGPGEEARIDVDVTIDPWEVTWKKVADQYSIALDIAVFAQGAGEKVLGERWDRIDLTLDADSYARVQRDGVRYTTTMQVTGRPTQAKVIVYEYDAGRTGHATTRLR